MALRRNPLTGQLEEDGLPADPNALPPIEAPPAEFNQVAAGAGAGGVAQPISVQVGSPDRPIKEIEQQVQGPKAVAAEKDLVAAQAATGKASSAEGAVEGQEAQIRQQYADERVAEKARAIEEARLDEMARRRRVDDAMASDAAAIEEDKKARLAAGKAHESFWAGRPGAQIFTKILQVIGGVAHDASGQGGPSPVDQALGQNIENHRRMLVNKWEATKEANALKRQDRQAFEAELERRSIWANNQSLAALEQLDEQMNAGIAGLSRERQAAARQVKDAALNEKRAELRQQNAQTYDQRIKRMEFAPGAGQPKTPLASREDVDAALKLEHAAQEREELAAKIEANEQSWKNVQTADKEYADEESVGEIPGAGKVGKAASRAMRGHDVAAKLAKSGSSLGRAFGGIFGTSDKVGAEVARGLEKVKTETAKGYGGAVTESDGARAAAELGVQSQDAKGIAATLRRQAAQMREKSTSMRSQRTFRQGPAGGKAPTPPAEGEVVRFGGKRYRIEQGKPVEVK
jgi:hypothetical protein